MSTTQAAKEKGPPGAGAATGEVPEDLKARGWEMKEHQGPEKDRFKLVNKALKLGTDLYVSPFDAIEAAARLQKKHDEKQPVARGSAAEPDGSFAVSRNFDLMLKVRLSADGLQEKCEEFDAVSVEIERMESDFKKVHDRFKEDLKAKHAEKEGLERVVRKQHVETEVACQERMYYGLKLVRVVRVDTGETVDERDMTEAETQQRLLAI